MTAARCPVALVESGESEASGFGHLQAQHVSRRYTMQDSSPGSKLALSDLYTAD